VGLDAETAEAFFDKPEEAMAEEAERVGEATAEPTPTPEQDGEDADDAAPTVEATSEQEEQPEG
jgi:hypothetical protein